MKYDFIIWKKRRSPKEGEKTFYLNSHVKLTQRELEEIVTEHFIREHKKNLDQLEFEYFAELD